MAIDLRRHPPQIQRSAVRGSARDRHLVWLADVLKATDMSASKLAEAIGFRSNLLTRWRKPENDAPLTTQVIEAIVTLTGLPGPDDQSVSPGAGFGEGSQVDFVDLRQKAPEIARLILGLTEKRANAHPWQLKTRALEGVGYRQGDYVIVDQETVPRQGDAVCAQVYEGTGARTVFRLYEPPYLLAASFDAELRRPLLIEDGRVHVIGVITQMVRNRG